MFQEKKMENADICRDMMGNVLMGSSFTIMKTSGDTLGSAPSGSSRLFANFPESVRYPFSFVPKSLLYPSAISQTASNALQALSREPPRISGQISLSLAFKGGIYSTVFFP